MSNTWLVSRKRERRLDDKATRKQKQKSYIVKNGKWSFGLTLNCLHSFEISWEEGMHAYF